MDTERFPPAIETPDNIDIERKMRNRHLIFAMLFGIGIRSVIILAELTGFVFFRSSALLVDALGTIVDVSASMILIVCIKLAARPPDEEHPFGHGRYEPLAGMQMGLFLLVLGLAMVVQQALQLIRGAPHRFIDPKAWLIPLVAAVLLEGCFFFLRYVAKKRQSTALLSEAYHYHIDALNSLFAATALVLVAFFPQWSAFLDHTGAIVIAVAMVIVGIIASRENVHQLIDKVPPQPLFDRVRKAAEQVPGVRGTEKLSIQQYGPDAHVNIDVEVDPTMTVDEAHAISQKVRHEIQRDWSAVRDVIVHMEPFYRNPSN